MDFLPREVLSEVLACLSTSEIASFVACSRTVHGMVVAMGCLSDASAFAKPVSAQDWDRKYAASLLLGPSSGSTGAITFRFVPEHYAESCLSRKVVLQSLALVGEHDAAKWLARHWRVPAPRPAPRHLNLFRHVAWDFVLYSIVCNTLHLLPVSPSATYVNVRSVPALAKAGLRMPASAQAFLCNLLRSAGGKDLVLHVCGTFHDHPYVPVARSVIHAERRRLEGLLQRAAWTDLDIQLYPEHEYRSSTLALGAVLATTNPVLRGFTLSHYVFDEEGPSVDVASFVSYLRWGSHELVRVNFHNIAFSCGDDFCDLLRALCRVPQLRSLRLSAVECLTPPPVDPLTILFEDGAHIKDLRVSNVMRTHAAFPFDALPLPGHRCLALTSMFLDTSSLRPLTLKLPTLTGLMSLDLSCNGIDGAALALFARALKERSCGIQRLKLASNIITGTGVFCFCDALSVNTSLLNLDLSDNFLGTHGGMALLKAALLNNGRIKYLNLDSNQVRYTMSDVYRILLACSGNGGAFRQVSLRANPIQAEDRDDAHKYTYFFKRKFQVSFNF